ncbi:MAG TPA: protein-L-isoaspartate(D-aspartate) O-methyltransferase [Rhodospirillaceae bacterium]|nr:protein-L-isoaspartate(D-aspartate) O-methyltransferase [Rhodospirillaceae bacterium]
MNGAARKIRLVMELRKSGVGDTKVLSALERVPREIFVPEPFVDQAYENTALPIGQGQTISQPLVVALMTQALEVGDRMKVLEVGTGSGYQTVVLAKLCRRVYTVERFKALLLEAEQKFRTLAVSNITAITGDGSRGWPEQAPFDRILVTAAAEKMPATLFAQLAEGGVMVLPIGLPGSDQEVQRIRKKDGHPLVERLFPVRFVPLVAGDLPVGN